MEPHPEVTVLLGDPRLPDGTKPGGRYTAEDVDAVVRLRAALAELRGYRFTWVDDHSDLVGRLVRERPSFVLNLCDTGYRNDPARELHVPALLELLELPYSGCGPACLGLCYDKGLVRAVAASAGVPVPAELRIPAQTLRAGGPWPSPAGWPVLVKPATGDGSLGITAGSLAPGPAKLASALTRLASDLPGRDALVQEFLSGTEFAVGLIGNPAVGLEALPLLEVDYRELDPQLPPILAYESKTVPSSPYWTRIRYREARVDPATREQLVSAAVTLFGRLGCRDWARFDFRADAAGRIRFLEANPNPAWCWDGKMNLMAGFAGISYSSLLARLLEASRARLAAGTG